MKYIDYLFLASSYMKSRSYYKEYKEWTDSPLVDREVLDFKIESDKTNFCFSITALSSFGFALIILLLKELYEKGCSGTSIFFEWVFLSEYSWLFTYLLPPAIIGFTLYQVLIRRFYKKISYEDLQSSVKQENKKRKRFMFFIAYLQLLSPFIILFSALLISIVIKLFFQ